jgi:hypothetical protein
MRLDQIRARCARRAQAAAPSSPHPRRAISQMKGGFTFPRPPGGVIEEATVVAVSVAVALLPPVGVIDVGEIEQLPGAGSPLQLKATVSVNLLDACNVTV